MCATFTTSFDIALSTKPPGSRDRDSAQETERAKAAAAAREAAANILERCCRGGGFLISPERKTHVCMCELALAMCKANIVLSGVNL